MRNGDIQPNKEITAAIRVDNPLDRHSTRNKRSCGSIVQVFVRMFQVDGVIGKIIDGKIIDGKIIDGKIIDGKIIIGKIIDGKII